MYDMDWPSACSSARNVDKPFITHSGGGGLHSLSTETDELTLFLHTPASGFQTATANRGVWGPAIQGNIIVIGEFLSVVTYKF